MILKKVKKILFFRLCCIGDVAMLTPVIDNLHRQFPDAEIDIAASGWIESLLPYLPYVKKAVIFDSPFNKNIIEKIKSTIKFIHGLRKEKYDLVFLAHRNSVYGLILKLSGIRYRFGFRETKFLTHSAEYDHKAHFVDRHLNILTANKLTAEVNNLILNPIIDSEELKKKNNIKNGHKVIGIFPFGGSNPGTDMKIKRWDYEKCIELSKQIASANKNITVLLFEGFLDDEKISYIPENENIKVLKIGIDLISVCNILISGDTGPLYIAEGFGVSTLSIFGPSDAHAVAPKSNINGVIHKYIAKKVYCSPCYTSFTSITRNDPKYWNGNTFLCHTGTHECMKSIQTNEVYNALLDIIDELDNTNL